MHLHMYRYVHTKITFRVILIAIYPQAAANLQTCFGEKLLSNSSEHWIINLKWDLPEGTYRSYFYCQEVLCINLLACHRLSIIENIYVYLLHCK